MNAAICFAITALIISVAVKYQPPPQRSHPYWFVERLGVALPCIYNSRTRNV